MYSPTTPRWRTPSLASEGAGAPKPFEFHASLEQLDEGLDVLHGSVAQLREMVHRGLADRPFTDLETAIGEIGANVLTHGSPPGSSTPVEYSLRWDGRQAVASFADAGPPVHNQIGRAMPAPTSEGGRGLALARLLLDELGYKREGKLNMWRLVKRL